MAAGAGIREAVFDESDDLGKDIWAMKLIGKCNAIESTVAKRPKNGGQFEEKRRFKISLQPATKLDAYYGYGDMNFITHGQELQDFGVTLDDNVEIFIVRSGEDYAHRQIEDVSRALYEAQGEVEAIRVQLESERNSRRRSEEEARNLRPRLNAMQVENVRLTTELETLKAARAQMPFDIKQIGPVV